MTEADLCLVDVVVALERLYPPDTAQAWDRVGLVSGDLAQPVRRVHLAVDPTLAVIAEAVGAHADLLVVHHPLLLRGVSSVATETAKGAAVTALIRSGLALYTAHTNADVAVPGVSDALAATVGLKDVEALDPATGIGRMGTLPDPVTLRALVERLAAALPPTPVGVRVAGDPDGLVRRVAVCGGAGDDLFGAVRAAGADAYVTADLRHHPALEAREEALTSGGGRPYLVDAGHWASEWLWLAAARDRLVRALGPRADRLETKISELRTDPWDFLVPTTP